MRCLQCGKAISLFKRLGGSSEFCSDAHRKEYQREYSQLALGRLMQSHSGESQILPVQAAPVASDPVPAVEKPPATAVKNEPAANGPSAAKPGAELAWAETARPDFIPYAPAPTPNKMATPQPLPAIPAKEAVSLPAASQSAAAKAGASQPATAQPAVIQKPAPAELQFAPLTTPEFEHAFASLAPDRPRRQPDMLAAELPHGRTVEWERQLEIADSVIQPMEPKLELREVSRTIPRIALDLSVVPPESLQTENLPLAIPITPAEPAEVSLWNGPHRDFAGELISVNNFADDQFSKFDFEVPVLAESPAATAATEPSPPQPQPVAVESEATQEETVASLAESQTPASSPTVRDPDPELDPLPVTCNGIAPVKAKPLPVFGSIPIRTGTAQIPQPNGLPLRPLMVLVTAAPAPVVQNRKSNILSLSSILSIKPEIQQSKTLGAPSPELNLSLAGFPASAGSGTSRMRKILAALTGAAALGAGIFFFLDKQSDAGLKSPATAIAGSAVGGQWIANFAPDARRQRRVSLLRSSMNLSAYRLDFESSIQMKALGWVYRAQDSKNFYVCKIELQKPGQNPVYALVRFAVINGVEQPRAETPLHVSVPMGGLYKIRFEAVGNRFTTWVQGQKVEQWTDARLSSGGAGLYGEGAEQSILHGEFAVTPLLN